MKIKYMFEMVNEDSPNDKLRGTVEDPYDVDLQRLLGDMTIALAHLQGTQPSEPDDEPAPAPDEPDDEPDERDEDPAPGEEPVDETGDEPSESEDAPHEDNLPLDDGSSEDDPTPGDDDPAPDPDPSDSTPFSLPNFQLIGVNISGAEFGKPVPGEIWKQYYWPGTKESLYWKTHGANVVRYPFKLERLFNQNMTMRDADWTKFRDQIGLITGTGMRVVIDPHNYAELWGGDFEDDPNLVNQFVDMWETLASAFKTNPRVIFGLMNEPKQISIDVWANAAQRSIDKIRGIGAMNHIFVPSIRWSAAHDFVSSSSAKLSQLTDIADNFSFEVHAYMDSNNSGTSATCVPGKAEERLRGVTDWGRQNGFKFFLGEFAVAFNDVCKAELDAAMKIITQNPDVWSGVAAWGGGPWWNKDYHFKLDPAKDGTTSPLLDYWVPYFVG